MAPKITVNVYICIKEYQTLIWVVCLLILRLFTTFNLSHNDVITWFLFLVVCFLPGPVAVLGGILGVLESLNKVKSM